MNFKDIKYERLNLKEIKSNLKQYEKKYRKAKSYEEAKQIEEECHNYTVNELQTPLSYLHICNTIDTSNKFYEDEIKYYNKKMIMFFEIGKKMNKDYLESPFKEEYLKEFGDFRYQCSLTTKKCQSKKIVFLQLKESLLAMKYSKLVASCKTDFHGTEMNFYGLLKEMQDPNRATRKEALEAWAKMYEGVSSELDQIFDKLVKNRVKQASRLHYKSFIEMIYAQRSRFDYDSNDVKRFRDYVVKYIVPYCQELYDEQKNRLGIDHLYYYDENLFYKEGALAPKGTTEELIQKANQMYHELSPETGEFFQFMKDNEYFDLETKPNKHMGGYCSSLPKYKAPFIFSNFNGTSADVDVLTHEAGHAFASYVGYRSKYPYDHDSMTMDIAEIHSMSMEHFTYPWMDRFFLEDADKYRLLHLENTMMCIPYLCAVDEFQHMVFENPKASALKRREYWHELEKKYLPWRDYGDIEFLNNGGFWMQKQHIFLYPFYYIDYALSQICAYQFYQGMNDNREDVWKRYYKLCEIAGHQGYMDTLKLVGLKSPFEEETIKNTVSYIKAQIEEMKKKI